MADIVTSRVFVDGEKGITAAKLNDIVASSVIQPAFYTSKPTAGTADPTDIALILKSGAYAQVPVSTLAGSTTQAQIWSTRLRSFNAIGNPSFEVDQKFCGTVTSLAAANIQDRWSRACNGTMVVSSQQIPTSVLVPGTDFLITQNISRHTLTTQQASLAAGNFIQIYQTIEGPNHRELSGAHSVSLLVRSSVANLQFSLCLSDPTSSQSLVKLCAMGAANTWTLIQLPNLPLMSGGTFSAAPGSAGHTLHIALASGTTFMAPAADTWQTGNFLGAPGMNNFAGSPVNSTFDIAFVQHEPGTVCSTLMDKPFSQNLIECQRYYQKSYNYPVVAGAVGSSGMKGLIAPSAVANAYGPVGFMQTMAKIPTGTLYNHSTGAANSVQDLASVNHASAATSGIGDSGFYGISFTTATTGPTTVFAHYTVDTGW